MTVLTLSAQKLESFIGYVSKLIWINIMTKNFKIEGASRQEILQSASNLRPSFALLGTKGNLGSFGLFSPKKKRNKTKQNKTKNKQTNNQTNKQKPPAWYVSRQ